MGLMQSYSPSLKRGAFELAVDPSDTVADLMARVGEQVGRHLLSGVWDPGTRKFHHAVHVFLDGERVEQQQQAVGQARELTLLLHIAGG